MFSSRRRRVRAARIGGVGQSEQLCPAQHVVRERGEHGPRAVCVELPGGKVRERLVLEVGDDLLNDRVVTVLGLHDGESLACGW